MSDEERKDLMELCYIMRDEMISLPAGSKERSAVADDMVKLLHTINENDRNSNEYFIKSDQNEEQAKKNEEEKRHNIWTSWLSVGSLSIALVDLIKDGLLTLVGYDYEDYHPVASFHLRTSLNRLFKKHNPPRV